MDPETLQWLETQKQQWEMEVTTGNDEGNNQRQWQDNSRAEMMRGTMATMKTSRKQRDEMRR